MASCIRRTDCHHSAHQVRIVRDQFIRTDADKGACCAIKPRFEADGCKAELTIFVIQLFERNRLAPLERLSHHPYFGKCRPKRTRDMGQATPKPCNMNKVDGDRGDEDTDPDRYRRSHLYHPRSRLGDFNVYLISAGRNIMNCRIADLIAVVAPAPG